MFNREILKGLDNSEVVAGLIELVYNNLEDIQLLQWTNSTKVENISKGELYDILRKLVKEDALSLHDIYKRSPNMAKACVSATYKAEIKNKLQNNFAKTLRKFQETDSFSLHPLDENYYMTIHEKKVKIVKSATRKKIYFYRPEEDKDQVTSILKAPETENE